MTENKSRRGTNWEQQLRDNEKALRREENEEISVVLLAGLQRLAEEAGIVSSDCDIRTPSDSMVQAIYRVTFTDGTTWVGTADCNAKNTKGRYLHYPTAVAESRAEARCLRKALGIRMLSAEELGLREGFGSIEASPSGKADSQMIAAITKLCETRGVVAAAVLEEVIEDQERASSIFELSELTTLEAQRALAWLNEQVTKKTGQQSAKSSRDARKAELTARLENQ